jgi:sporulation protein YlmC with PRC-barrel domain
VIRLTDLLNLPLVTESGEKLGHVFDVRVRRRPGSSHETADQQWRIEGLLIGQRGLRDRLGVRGSKSGAPTREHGVVPWSAVLEIGESEIRVRNGAAARPSPPS